MKIVTYQTQQDTGAGIYHEGKIWPMKALDSALPRSILDYLQAGENAAMLAGKWN